MAGRKIVIEFLGKNSTDKTTRAVEQRFGKLGGTLDRVGQRAGKVLAVGLAAAGAAAVSMAKSAGEDEAAASRLAQTLKTAAGATSGQVRSTEAWITAQGKALGVSDDELRPALSKLAVATGDVGAAQRLAALGMDISAGSGKSLESVSAALAKAQNGNTAGLAKLGIATKDASGKALSFDQIQKNLAATYKGAAAKGAETTAGKTKIMAVQFQELQEQIGAKLLPVMQKLVSIGLGVTNWISHNATTTGILIGVLGTFAALLYAASAAMRLYTLATSIQEIMTKRAAAGQWTLNASLLANPIGLIVVGIAALVAGLVIAYKKSETFRKIVDGAFRAVQVAASFAFNWVKRNWPLLLAIITGPFGLAVYAVVKNWDRIKQGAATAITFVKGKFNDFVGFFRAIPGRMRSAFSGMFDGIKGAFRAAINWVIDRWNGLAFRIPAVNTHIPGVGSVGGFTLGTPNINRLAKGGIVKARRGGTLALLAEAGHDERVEPLSGPYARKSAGGGGDTYNIYVSGALDADAVAKQIEQMLSRRQRMTGRGLGLA